MDSADVKLVLMALGISLSLGWNVYQAIRYSTQDARSQAREIETLRSDVEGLKTKVGLFWHLVEEHMSSMLAKANPIHLSLDEQAAAVTYRAFKNKSPTGILKILEPAIDRELKKGYLQPDETLAFVCLLGAIRSQLYDRGEWTDESRLT